MLRPIAVVGLSASLAGPVLAQSAQKPETRIQELERRVAELEAGREATGRAGRDAPASLSAGWSRHLPQGGGDQEGLLSLADERVKIGGRLDMQFYDRRADRRDLGTYGGRSFGGTSNSGSTEFRVRRLQLNLDITMIEDFRFFSTLTLDPVVKDQDEGAVDLDEAYFRFGNVARNLLGFEDPSHSFVQMGNYYRWERGFMKRWAETFSMAGTALYMDEVTGLQIGGDFEEGVFYRVSVENGSNLIARDAGSESIAASPILQDDEALGDANNTKDLSLGLGIREEVDLGDDSDVGYRLAVSYRNGRLSGTERSFLTSISGAYDGTSNKTRFGVLGGLDYESAAFGAGVDAELWTAGDGNAERNFFSVGPWVELELDGVYYQQRLFFTGIGFGYRLSGLHQKDGLPNSTDLGETILDDRIMHTVGMWIDVTRNVEMRVELNDIEEARSQVHDTEWFVQWSVRF